MKHPKCWVASEWHKVSWLDLLKGIIRFAVAEIAKVHGYVKTVGVKATAGRCKARAIGGFLHNCLFVQKSTVSEDALVLAKWLRRWLTTPLFMLALLAWVLWPHPAKIIYAEPTSSKSPAPQLIRITMAKKLPAPAVAPVAPVPAPAPPPLPPPAPVPAYVPPTPVYGCGADPMMAYIYRVESGCNTGAYNPGGCRGLGQACPGSKLPCSDSDWACQDSWFRSYAVAAYGSIYNAYIFRLNHNWW